MLSTEGSQTFSNEDSEQHDPIYVNLEVSLTLNPGDIKWLSVWGLPGEKGKAVKRVILVAPWHSNRNCC